MADSVPAGVNNPEDWITGRKFIEPMIVSGEAYYLEFDCTGKDSVLVTAVDYDWISSVGDSVDEARENMRTAIQIALIPTDAPKGLHRYGDKNHG